MTATMRPSRHSQHRLSCLPGYFQGGRLVNHRAGTTPLFVHYNGMAKDPGHVAEPMDMKSLYKAIAMDVAPKPVGRSVGMGMHASTPSSTPA